MGGKGFGIQTFKPQRGPLTISANLKIPNLAKVLQRNREHAEDYVDVILNEEPQKGLRHWSVDEMQAAEAEGHF